MTVGILKEMDKLGRIVIPKEIRDRFGLAEHVELIVTESGVLLRSPEYKLVQVNTNENCTNDAFPQ